MLRIEVARKEIILSALLQIITNHSSDILDIHPVDYDGFRLMPLDISLAQLEANITPLLNQLQWIVIGHIRGGLLIEQYHTKNVSVSEGEYLYHVSDRENRKSIAKKGLKVGNGGNTIMQRKYNGRLFLARDLPAAFEFIEFQCRKKRNPFTGKVTASLKQRKNLDVWKVCIPDDLELFRDVLFPGKAVWCEDNIDSKFVSFYKDWKKRDHKWKKLRRKGIY